MATGVVRARVRGRVRVGVRDGVGVRVRVRVGLRARVRFRVRAYMNVVPESTMVGWKTLGGRRLIGRYLVRVRVGVRVRG